MEPLAIVGLAFKFPGDATSPEGFWEVLNEKRCLATEFPSNRMNIDSFYDANNEAVDKLRLRKAHFLKEDIGAFDAPFFSVSPAEAAAMDPQQRGLLETCYHALEDAGIPIESVSGTDTAVFTGSFGDDHKIISLKDAERLSPHAGSSTTFSMLANRLSWWFNLKGPSMNIDTACSSSLVGLHLACQSLRLRESSMALVGGSNIMSSVEQFLLMSNLNMLSPSGCCYSFDHRANGYARGEGYGIVVVKRLTDALANGDVIRAVIRATGTNQDGKTPSLTSPSQEAQEKLIVDTYQRAGLDLSRTAFVEAHGTGTPVGDPIEARALGSTFGRTRSVQNPVYIGSTKSNIGHLEGGSGIAGLIKAVLALERGIIPPNANFEKSSKDIDAGKLNIKFPIAPTEWPTPGLRRASINSFGFGGANSHAVLDDACNFLRLRGLKGYHLSIDSDFAGKLVDSDAEEWLERGCNSRPKLLTWSASDNKACSRLMNSYIENFKLLNDCDTDLDRLAFTLATRRSVLSSRFFVVVSSSTQLINLQTLCSAPIRSSENRNLGFIFTGQGAQYSQMGLGLISYPVFKNSLDRSSQYLQDLGCQWDLLAEIRNPQEMTRINKPEFSQPVCTALQIALVDLLRSMMVFPTMVVGHSSGEIAAAYAVAAIDHHSAIKIAYFRGQVASVLDASPDVRGAMLAVAMSAEEASKRLIDFEATHSYSTIVVACINSPSSVTLSGDDNAIEDIKAELAKDGIAATKLRVSVAYHSPHMQRISQEYEALIGTINPGKVSDTIDTDRMVSSVTTRHVTMSQLRKAEYWIQNMVSTVRFDEAVATALSSYESFDVLEVGPHSALRGPFEDIASSVENPISVNYDSTLRRNFDATETFLAAMGRLHCLGHKVDLLAANGLNSTRNIKPLANLPPYPFDHSKVYWDESRRSREFRLKKTPRSTLLGSPIAENTPPQVAKTWRKITRLQESPWLAGHVVNGSVIYPAASMLSMAIEAAYQTAGSRNKVSAFRIENAEFLRPIYVPEHSSGVESFLELSPWTSHGSSSVAHFTLCTLEEEDWAENCRGIIAIEYEKRSQYPNGWHDGEQPRDVDVAELYRSFDSIGLVFGTDFQSLTQLTISGSNEALSQVRVFHLIEQHVIHPITLDGIFQTVLAALLETSTNKVSTAVPTMVEDLWIAATKCNCGESPSLQVRARVQETSENHTLSTAQAYGDDGEIAMSLGCLRTTFIDSTPSKQEAVTDHSCYEVTWNPDIDLLNETMLAGLAQAVDNTAHFRDLAILLLGFCRKVLSRFDPTKTTPRTLYLENYIRWMRECVSGLNPDLLSLTNGHDGMISVDDLSHKVSAASSHGVGLVEIGRNLLEILHGELSPLEVIFKSGFEERYYTEMNIRTEPALSHVVELLAFKHPGMRVLEIGAGTGSSTDVVLKHANIIDSNNIASGAISVYHFTDISPAFFSAAKTKFAAYEGLMRFSTLDISKDPLKQGFKSGDYDLIVAANVLHATPNLNTTLTNVQRLLRPGGKLVMLEVTENQWIAQAIFGTLPGWWLRNDEYRTCGPCISTTTWDKALKGNGFSGLDTVIHDSNDQANRICSTLVTTAVQPSSKHRRLLDFVILTDKQHLRVAEKVKSSLLSRIKASIKVLSILQTQNYDFSGKFCISLLELTRPVLESMTNEDFTTLRSLLSSASSVLWVRDRKDISPDHHLIDGVFRVLRLENPDPAYITLTTSNADDITAHLIRLTENMLRASLNASKNDTEYIVEGNQLSISRSVPSVRINQYVQDGRFNSRLDPDATYAISGGFGGIALRICRWLVQQGARNLLLLSRSGPKSAAAKKLLAELASQNIRVESPACDITSIATLERTLSISKLPPIKGCIQGALVLQDALFEFMTHDQWQAAIRPRVAGTRNLYDLMPDLSFFVLMSSAVGVLGNRGQGNYAASNAYLDAFAHYNKRPATRVVSIDVGWVDFAGTAAESEDLRRHLASLGCLAPMSEAEMLSILDYVCQSAPEGNEIPAQIITGIKLANPTDPLAPRPLDQPLWRAAKVFSENTMSQVIDRDARLLKPEKVPVATQLKEATSEASTGAIISQAFVSKLADNLGLEEEAIYLDKPLYEIGVDSLIAVQLRGWFWNELGVNVTVFDMMSKQSLRSIIEKVVLQFTSRAEGERS
ncbi:unnamed protein product [Clonostachys byssicola]|uniref:Polyketide synthase n=1 Tax=Clonostachys byssicola TaxID=160290 RepID=A0A9N9Y3M2_9HYPO|nr:unnamed protein product [Clonostachys byssicola]